MAPISLEGQMLGKYNILEPVGRGGMAQVYRAYHAKLDRYVAIKVLRSDLVGEHEFLARFSREARAVAALRHPNIVQVFDFDVQDEYYYMVMELVEGDTLMARMTGYRSRGEMMPVKDIVSILTDVLNGLGYAHGEGVIHRDVKPANILLNRRGQAVITDFGIAQIIGGTNYTVSGALMGTLHYMAPEQGMGTNVDGRSDLYALGVVLYEILTGHPPFDADTPLAILMKHLNDPLPLPQEPERVIPAPFERVVLKALAKKPDERYQTAAEMTLDLQKAAAECGVEFADLSNNLQVMDKLEPVALKPDLPQVYSGDARQNLMDENFAADVTDMNLDQHLKQEIQQPASGNTESLPQGLSPELSASLDDVVKSAAKLFSTVGGVVSDAMMTANHKVKQYEPAVNNAIRDLQAVQLKTGDLPSRLSMGTQSEVENADEVPGFQEPQFAGTDLGRIESQPNNVAKSALLGVGILIGVNLLAIAIGSMTGWWGFYQYGWPAQMLLVAFLLSLLMGALSNIWLLIPSGILIGNGIALGYLSTTGSWRFGGMFFLLEPILVGGIIYMTIYLERNAPHQAQFLANRLGKPLALISIGMVMLIGLGSLVATVIRGLFN